jgi:hypothetical protein
MAEIIIEKPSMQKVIYKLEKPSEELAFAYYILFVCSHAYSMRQRKVLTEDFITGTEINIQSTNTTPYSRSGGYEIFREVLFHSKKRSKVVEKSSFLSLSMVVKQQFRWSHPVL